MIGGMVQIMQDLVVHSKDVSFYTGQGAKPSTGNNQHDPHKHIYSHTYAWILFICIKEERKEKNENKN